MRYCQSVQWAVCAAVLAGVVSWCAHAQTPALTEPTELSAARKEALNRILAASRQLTEQYVRALARLEDELAAASDYDAAIAVQARIRELGSAIQAGPASATNANAIALASTSAKTTGSLFVDGEVLTGWRTHGSTAEWTLPALAPGRYALELSYHLSDAPVSAIGSTANLSRFSAVETAAFKFSEVSLLAPANTRNLQLTKSADASTYNTARTEPLNFTRSRTTVKLEAADAYPANVIRIKNIRLIPLPDTPPATTTAPTPNVPQQNVSALRQVFQKQLATVRSSLLERYESELRTFAAQPAVAADRDLLEDAEQEQRRARMELASPSPMIQRKAPGSLARSALDGFEDLPNARLVIDPASTADRIKVEHDGRQFWISLAWVRCPPATPDDKDALAASVKHFGIVEEDALTVGRVAREFTQGYLEGKPLRLLVRARKNDGQPAQALVFLDGVGLFQSVLVDHGFAALSIPAGSERKPILETTLINLIRERERTASARKPAPGAWAFKTEGSP